MFQTWVMNVMAIRVYERTLIEARKPDSLLQIPKRNSDFLMNFEGLRGARTWFGLLVFSKSWIWAPRVPLLLEETPGVGMWFI